MVNTLCIPSEAILHNAFTINLKRVYGNHLIDSRRVGLYTEIKLAGEALNYLDSSQGHARGRGLPQILISITCFGLGKDKK